MAIADVVKRVKGTVLNDERADQVIVDVFKEIFTHFRTIIFSIREHKNVITLANVKKPNYQTQLLGLLAAVNTMINDLKNVDTLNDKSLKWLCAVCARLRLSVQEFKKQLLKPAEENLLVHYRLVYNSFKETIVDRLIEEIDDAGKTTSLQKEIKKTLEITV
ncbi:hypothetical protein HY490_04205 [Candidatus Woesearchaeota archaeon]|nr:hypothetical protein [Candidatus Woesearchaeota archaeon]